MNIKKIISSITIGAGAIILGLGIQYAVADWTAAQNTPPICPSGQPGCDAPINVGGVDQIKDGGLGIGKVLTVTGQAIMNAGLRVTGQATMNTGLKVVGTEIADTVSATSTVTKKLTIPNATVGDYLNVGAGGIIGFTKPSASVSLSGTVFTAQQCNGGAHGNGNVAVGVVADVGTGGWKASCVPLTVDVTIQ